MVLSCVNRLSTMTFHVARHSGLKKKKNVGSLVIRSKISFFQAFLRYVWWEICSSTRSADVYDDELDDRVALSGAADDEDDDQNRDDEEPA